MKKRNIFKFLVLLTVFSLNIQWFGFGREGQLVNVADATIIEYITVNQDGDGGGNDFIGRNDVPPSDVINPTKVVPNPATGIDLSCPWECGESYWYPQGYVAIPQMCTEGDEMIAAIRADMTAGTTGDWDGNGLWGADSVYNAGEKVAWDGLWVWKKYNVTTGIGWTGWWVALANYCEANGYWSSSNKNAITYGSTATITFTVAERTDGTGTYGVDLLAKTTESIRMQGNYAAGATIAEKTVTSPNFNSPFIYFDVPDGDYSVSLDSQWDRYQSVTPDFTKTAGWDVSVEQGNLTVDGSKQKQLFYELAMSKIDLSRSGINFASKESLEAYLKHSDFFSRLHMNDKEKQNSLEYLLPRLSDSPNYYLTILSDDAIKSLSNLTVTPVPEQLVRTYYAVYPTVSPVKTEGELQYPSAFDQSKPTVKEYGEIIVKPEMYVFWK